MPDPVELVSPRGGRVTVGADQTAGLEKIGYKRAGSKPAPKKPEKKGDSKKPAEKQGDKK